MIEQDRILLNRMARLNLAMGEVVIAMMDHQDGGELNETDLREFGGHLRQLGVDLLARADELAHHPVIDSPPPEVA